jgi:GrpB-like predicted nucleotidyltransferase (UPF0157 family)
MLLVKEKRSKSSGTNNLIVIQSYKPEWIQEFESIRAELQEVLEWRALRIDHIGSTSVPGLGAKDVIDVQITVQELSPKIIQKMVNAGYEHRGNLTHDHIPLGEDEDPKLWEKYVFIEQQGQRRANIHVRVDGNPNQCYPLLFRDYLRAHPNSARSIEHIKREIAKRHADDIEAYYDIKDPVYDLIWDAALDWAKYTNWKPV